MVYLNNELKLKKMKQANVRSQMTMKNKSMLLQKIIMHHILMPLLGPLSTWIGGGKYKKNTPVLGRQNG